MSAHSIAREALAESVVVTIAEVTRYPRSILAPEADLEEELGIESVKRAEILAVLGQRLHLPPPAEGSLAQLKTVGDVIAAVERAVAAQAGGNGDSALSPPLAPPAGPPEPSVATVPAAPLTFVPAPPRNGAAGPLAANALAEVVIATIAEVTRYPRSVLLLEAELEDELGIESVKRAEILGALGSKLGLAPPSNGSLGSLKTIADVIAAVGALVDGHALPMPVAPAPPAFVPPPPSATPVLSPPAAEKPLPAAAREALRPDHAPLVPAPTPVSAPASRATSAQPFAGKVVLVTGSGRGLGKAVAQRLARLGASVVVNSFHSPDEGAATAAELVREGHDAIHVWGSAANPEQLDEVFHTVGGRFGHLDFLVWNASDARAAPIADLTADDWNRAFRTDVIGFHKAAFRAAALMTERGGGKIVSITHPASQRCFEQLAVLGTVKSALESLTRYLAIELGPKNIQVNSVSAGPCREHVDRYPNRERLVPQWEARTPGGRLPSEAAVAHAVAFLLSPDSSQMAGSIITVDAGVLLST
jgi:enoyl-[acyl-carrier protein] reductase III